MLHKSGYNLEKGAIDFISNNESITLLSAYIKLEQLKALNTEKKITRIVVRWDIEDLVKGVSDFEDLYEYCTNNNIALFRNTRIHLKVIWNNENSVIYGSANITGRGIGEKGDNYNYELAGIAKPISFDDISYLNFIIQESEFVTDGLFFEIRTIVDNIELPTIEFPELPTKKKLEDEFLISQLPMTSSPDLLFEILQNSNNFSLEDQLKAAHDKALYNINIEAGIDTSLLKLKTTFNSKAIIENLKLDIKSQNSQSLRYGGVVEWIKNNTTTVPTPMSWEIKKEQLVNNLYEWICEFDEEFTWNTPNHTQVIIFNDLTLL
jgi:hypothetical protein